MGSDTEFFQYECEGKRVYRNELRAWTVVRDGKGERVAVLDDELLAREPGRLSHVLHPDYGTRRVRFF